MLIRYVGVTLVALGGAMVLAPPPDDRAEAPRPTVQASRAQATPAAVSVDAARAAARQVADAEARDGATDPGQVVRARLSDAPEPTVHSLARPVPEPPVPTLSDPESVARAGLGPTPGTQALIDAAERAQAAGPVAAASPAGRDRIWVTGSRVNVRSGPSTAYGVIGSVRYGDALELLAEDTGNWARVRLPDGRPGFVAFSLLSREPSGG